MAAAAVPHPPISLPVNLEFPVGSVSLGVVPAENPLVERA